MASGESGDRGRGPRCSEERTGGRSDAVQVFWSECGMAAVGGDFAQRDDGAKASGAAGGVADGAAQATAVSDLQYSGATGTACAENGAAVGRQRAANRRMAGSRETAAGRGLNRRILLRFWPYRRICAPLFSCLLYTSPSPRDGL